VKSGMYIYPRGKNFWVGGYWRRSFIPKSISSFDPSF